MSRPPSTVWHRVNAIKMGLFTLTMIFEVICAITSKFTIPETKSLKFVRT